MTQKFHPADLRFPVSLRKMWSVQEIQAWLDAQGMLYRRAERCARINVDMALVLAARAGATNEKGGSIREGAICFTRPEFEGFLDRLAAYMEDASACGERHPDARST